MVVHLARVAFDVVVFRASFDDFEILAGHDHVRGVGAAGPFLAVRAVAQGCYHRLAGVFIADSAAHAAAFGHFEERGGR